MSIQILTESNKAVFDHESQKKGRGVKDLDGIDHLIRLLFVKREVGKKSSKKIKIGGSPKFFCKIGFLPFKYEICVNFIEEKKSTTLVDPPSLEDREFD